MRTSVLVPLLIGTASILAACSGSQPSLSLPAEGLASQQSLGRNSYQILHPFGRSAEDGAHPAADLIDVNGTLYGTTVSGGSHGAGTVFSITASGQETVLHSFGSSGDGAKPSARLLNVNGTLYGTTSLGGKNYSGTVFSITLGGAEKVLHSFDSSYQYGHGNGGSIPEAGLTNVKGTLYGTTAQGGAYPCNSAEFCGTVYSITTNSKFKVLHSFGKGPNEGAFPQADLLNLGGTLYGTTMLGGNHDAGVVFSITTAGEEHTVYSFGTNANDSSNPVAPLVDVQGTLYGTTSGGVAGGMVFSVTTDGTERVLHRFGGSDGSQPLAGLKNVKGVLYGTTAMGGANNLGTVFRITKSGKETVLHSFASGGGQQPRAGLAAIGGTLYGTTNGGRSGNSYGNVFSLTP